MDVENYTVTLMESRITKISIDLQLEGEEELCMKAASNAYEPTNPDDPTILVRTDFSFQSKQSNNVKISCTTEHIFKLNPIPEKRIDLASQRCPQIIAKDVSERIKKIISNMGNGFTFKQNEFEVSIN